MSRPRFLADEDFRAEIVLAVRRMEPVSEFLRIDELNRKGSDDSDVLEFADQNGLIVVSHDVNTMRGLANARIADGRGIAGLFLATQNQPTRSVADSLVL